MNIKIAIDARHLSEELTGIGRYVYEIISRLIRNGANVEWHLYSHREIIVGNWDHSNVYIHHCRIKNRILRMLWAQFYLPICLKRDNINIFWSPAHRIPFFINRSIRCVVTIHDFVWKYSPKTMRFLSRYLDTLLMPMSIKIANKVICVSNSTKNDIVINYPKFTPKLITIYEAPTILSRLKITNLSKDPFILFVGTLEPRKNLERLLAAFKLLISNYDGTLKLNLVGGKGWGKVNIANLIIDMGLINNVNVLGYVRDEELFDLYSNALFTAMPSLYEGFGLPILESYSCGTPVLTSNNSSMLEIGGSAAHFVDPYSINSIKDGLEKLIYDVDYLNALKLNTYFESSKYSWEKAADETFMCLMSSD
ncbi:glycosyltransferase family 1 protein [Polynucleobacter sp. MWH-UH35A]|uniref:glycosyltransferase family 4 protein n=1 Tax=Polynucleobacter sp. MWH-UH35A TaxID=1855619 RepID=UPI001BFE4BA2|nr:glycosyltransferase family 1 protein [Polynucleobacter sp. MWH-UH35A]QWD60455.1 glycosyltransferase family 4 protein [Polynucleobacter sp. MWH-UH35A]